MLAYYFSLYIPCDAIINEILKSQTMWEMLNIHPIFLHMFYECSTCDQECFFKHVRQSLLVPVKSPISGRYTFMAWKRLNQRAFPAGIAGTEARYKLHPGP